MNNLALTGLNRAGNGAANPLPYDPVRALGFNMGLALVFLRFSMLHQVQATLIGVNLRLLYVFGLPALLGLIAAGGIQRTFRGRPAFYWAGFAVCLVVATPFSIWRGGSASLVVSYLRVDFLMLFILGGLVVTWRDCRLVMCTIAWAAAFNLLTSSLFTKDSGDRTTGAVGSLGNANDFAAHLLLVLPFLLWVTLTAKSFTVRVTAILGVTYGCLVIMRTGSRGGLVGLLAALLVFFLFYATPFQRLALVVAIPLAVLVILSSLPAPTLRRITSFTASADVSEEAIASSNAREYLLSKSIEYTVEHPLVGVGPGQFSQYEGRNNRLGGTAHGYWHETHNTFTQVSSECGIPALLFFVASIVSSFALLNSTYRQVSSRVDCRDMRAMISCIILGLSAFCVGIFFLSFAYMFYLPALGGLAISVSCAARGELSRRVSA